MHCTGSDNRLLLAAGKTTHQLVRTVDSLDCHNGTQDMGSDVSHLSHTHETKEAYQFSSHKDVACNRHGVNECRVLVNRLNAQLCGLCVGVERNGFAIPDVLA